MPAIDSGLADWLKAPALFASIAEGGIIWGDRGVLVEQTTPLNTRAAVVSEAARFNAFHKGPNTKDRVVVPGRRRDLLGKVVTLKSKRSAHLGYEGAGTPALVIGVAEGVGVTNLTVIRKLI